MITSFRLFGFELFRLERIPITAGEFEIAHESGDIDLADEEDRDDVPYGFSMPIDR